MKSLQLNIAIFFIIIFQYTIGIAQPTIQWHWSGNPNNNSLVLEDWLRQVIGTSDGGYIGVGYSEVGQNGIKNPSAVKINGKGGVEWNQVFSDSNPNNEGQFWDAVEVSDGYVFIGEKVSPSNNKKSVYLIKVDKLTGAITNTVYYKSSDFSGFPTDGLKGASIRPIFYGGIHVGYIIAGTCEVSTGLSAERARGIVLIRTDKDFFVDQNFGSSGWRVYNRVQSNASNERTRANQVRVIYDNNNPKSGTPTSFVVTGNSVNSNESTDRDALLLRTHYNGNKIWMKTYGKRALPGATTNYRLQNSPYNYNDAQSLYPDPTPCCTASIVNKDEESAGDFEQISKTEMLICADFDIDQFDSGNHDAYCGEYLENDAVLFTVNILNGTPSKPRKITHFGGIDYSTRMTKDGNFIYLSGGHCIQMPNNNLGVDVQTDIVKLDAYDYATPIWKNTYIQVSSNNANCTFGLAISKTDGGVAFGGNNELVGEDYFITKLQGYRNWIDVSPTLANNQLNSAAATGADGMIYVVGGGTTGNPTARMEKYDPLMGGNWVPAHEMLTARQGLSLVFGPDGFLYAIGGGGHLVPNPGLVERYNTKTDTWTALQSLPQGSLTAAVGPGNKIYAVTWSGTGALMYMFEPPTGSQPLGQWIPKPAPQLLAMPTYALTGLDNNLYLTSGDYWAKYDGTQWVYLPESTFANGVTVVQNGDFYLLKGNKEVSIYHLNGHESILPNQLYNHSGHMALTSAEGRIFVLTGSQSTNPSVTFKQLESYGPIKAPDFSPNCNSLWRFDAAINGKTYDDKGLNDGILVGNPTFVNGRVGKSITLNGNAQYIKMNDSPSLNFGTSSMTFEGWIKCNNVGSGIIPIIDKRTEPTAGKYLGYHTFVFSNKKFGFQLANGTDYQNYYSESNIEPNVWTHVAVTVDRSTSVPTVSIYVNSVLEKTYTALSGTNTNTAQLYIGNHYKPNANIPFYKGELDELALYNRALNWAEIRAIFLAGKEGKQ